MFIKPLKLVDFGIFIQFEKFFEYGFVQNYSIFV